MDARGTETRGTLEVTDPLEAVRRIKEMGMFPTKVLEDRPTPTARCAKGQPARKLAGAIPRLPFLGILQRRRVKTSVLTVFTRQLATLLDAGMPLLRGLRTLREQEESAALKRVISGVSESIEGGSSLADALQAHPRVFNRLYVNMVKAGEVAGALETTLGRLADFMEKAQAIRRKVTAAMFYPSAVIIVAMSILTLLMTFVVPRFKGVFEGLLNNATMPAFTMFVFRLSEVAKNHAPWVLTGLATVVVVLALLARTQAGRWILDQLKLSLPIVGPLFRKVALARFSRTLGTLAESGVPILQALTIVRETAGNAVIARVISRIHEQVKQGEAIAPTLKSSKVFPAMVAGMVDVGEQTGALPEMLMKVADVCEDEVDTATTALTSLLEPILIVFLAVVVGSIVIAMFLPLIEIIQGFDGGSQGEA